MLLATTTESLRTFVPTLIQGAGLTAFFASRTFIPAFATALTLRFGLQAEWFDWFGIEVAGTGAPSWFTTDTALIVLGLLAVLEVAATKSADARAVMAEIDPYIKPAIAVLTYLGVASTVDAAYLQEHLVEPQEAGFIDLIPAAAIAAATWWTTVNRREAVGLLAEADEDDDLGVQKLFSWAEDLWAAIGPWLLVIFGVLMLVVAAVVVGIFFLLRMRARIKDEQSKIDCKACGEKVYGCAVQCPQCGAKVDAPRGVGFFGTTKPKPATNLDRHPYRLVEKKRCPACATRFEQRQPRQACPACRHDLFADRDFAEAYLGAVASRLPTVLGVSFLFSLVPVVGLIPGVIYYRLAVVAPFRRYIPRGRALLLRWGIKLFFLLLILVQWVPLLGGAVVPLMALINYRVYRSTFEKLLREPPPTSSQAPAA
jgi:Zn finger protein HypA/HybF involved in hydrogenase expression